MPDVPQLNIRRDFDGPKQTPRGGFTKSELAKYGVGWPPPKGWKKELARKPLGYRKYSKDDIKPTDLKLPHPFKCSRCDFTGENRDTLNRHYFSWH